MSKSGDDDEALKMLAQEGEILKIKSGFNTNPNDFLKHIFDIKRPKYRHLKWKSVEIMDIIVSVYKKESFSQKNAKSVFQCLRDDNIEEFRKFLENGFDINFSNAFGETLFHHACRSHALNCINELIERGVNYLISTNLGKTPLHSALCFRGEVPLEVIRILCGLEPRWLLCVDEQGCTPLDYVCGTMWPVMCDHLNLCFDIYLETFDHYCQQNKCPSSISSDASVEDSNFREYTMDNSNSLLCYDGPENDISEFSFLNDLPTSME